ncbi:Glu/Leu/Phe/Val dehydrogenase dimerization domain-containing protein [Archaeoglobus sp.]|nr:Glu/Leu/Phe/Val dehydrogenase dimerization domain-containing protein [Archaeoglobus sp.]MDI3498661.1 hypothetical protein [Archaeoglobus sp.]
MDVVYDEIGPEVVMQFYDPKYKIRSFLVLDTLKFGACAGGIRMLPDVTVEEVAWLVRAMSLKAAIFGIPVGGAKGGICADPNSEHRREILTSYARYIAQFLKKALYIPGSDMGTS